MSERKTSEIEIQRIVQFYSWPTQEGDIIQETKNWNGADFAYAIDRLFSDQPAERRDALRPIYLRLLKSRQADESRVAAEEAANRRHNEISRRLDELRKPHWSVVPNFWLTVAILILTAIGVYLALRQ